MNPNGRANGSRWISRSDDVIFMCVVVKAMRALGPPTYLASKEVLVNGRKSGHSLALFHVLKARHPAVQGTGPALAFGEDGTARETARKAIICGL